ncbi:MAG: hypothetical protein EAZ57_11885 [Cytophagales bacterium]|nr:MAG: hypothetical protein EAZ67_14295 [Cytophagales bacterium]TAF59189.1 MAG: hypothetical protein EAZ57_11885 [Cytophagales bacterium]
MKVNIDEIQKITSLLLSKLKESKGNEIEISNDYYWDISQDELYSPYEEPKKITLGQLSDDLEEVQRLIKSDDAVMYDLKRLSNILKVLSIENQTAF